MLTHSVDVVGSNGRGGAAGGSGGARRMVSTPMTLLRKEDPENRRAHSSTSPDGRQWILGGLATAPRSKRLRGRSAVPHIRVADGTTSGSGRCCRESRAART